MGVAADQPHESLQPSPPADRALRRRLGVPHELALAVLPTLTVVAVLGLVEVFSRQRLLFASLASSAFLIYLDPRHGTNTVRTLVTSQLAAAAVGFAFYALLGPGYGSGASAMLVTIFLMIALDVVHPPAISTSLSFAFRAGDERNLVLFALTVGLVAGLVVIQRASLWLVGRFERRPARADGG
ncbi:MAG TPA: HPP family protein [Humisphaera sp.]